MIHEIKSLVNGSFLLSPAHGRVGARATSFLFQCVPPPSTKFFRVKPKQAGKKEGGWGEGIFARLPIRRRRTMGWESVSAIPLVRGRQNRKIFFSLFEKNFGGARLKKCKENFSVLLAESAGWRRRRAETRWAGFNPQNPLDFAQKRFGFRPNSTAITHRPFTPWTVFFSACAISPSFAVLMPWRAVATSSGPNCRRQDAMCGQVAQHAAAHARATVQRSVRAESPAAPQTAPPSVRPRGRAACWCGGRCRAPERWAAQAQGIMPPLPCAERCRYAWTLRITPSTRPWITTVGTSIGW